MSRVFLVCLSLRYNASTWHNIKSRRCSFLFVLWRDKLPTKFEEVSAFPRVKRQVNAAFVSFFFFFLRNLNKLRRKQTYHTDVHRNIQEKRRTKKRNDSKLPRRQIIQVCSAFVRLEGKRTDGALGFHTWRQSVLLRDGSEHRPIQRFCPNEEGEVKGRFTSN